MKLFLLCLALSSCAIAGCDGIEDIPNDRVICCQNGEVLTLMKRIDCVYDPAGRVVAYALCETDAAVVEDAGP